MRKTSWSSWKVRYCYKNSVKRYGYCNVKETSLSFTFYSYKQWTTHNYDSETWGHGLSFWYYSYSCDEMVTDSDSVITMQHGWHD